MLFRVLLGVLSAALLAGPVWAQSGLQLPREQGLDPTYARGWLAPEFDRFGFVTHPWRDTPGFTPAQRSHWNYTFSPRSNLGMSYVNSPSRDLEREQRMSLYGSYWFSTDWGLSAESLSREPGGLLRLQDFRIGVQRRF